MECLYDELMRYLVAHSELEHVLSARALRKSYPKFTLD